MATSKERRPLRKGKVLAGAAAAAVAAPASAATITVNSLADAVVAGNGQCTLREAVNNSNANADTTGGDCVAGAGADTIAFSVAGTITLTGGALNLTDSVTVQGPGAGSLTVSGNSASQVFYSSSPVNVTISGLALTGGNGGAIFLDGATSLTLTNTLVSGNTSGNRGGGVFVRNATSVSITGSTVSGNTSTSGAGGGGLFLYRVSGSITISSSTVSGNTAPRGGGIKLYDTSGPTTISDSTISGNTSSFAGGGIFLYKPSAPVTIQRSTISGNSATVEGGGLFFYKDSAAMTLEDSTISGNTSATGGGIFLLGAFPAGHSLDINHTTMQGNTATTAGGNIAGGSSANTINIADSIIAGGASPTGPDISNGAATVNMNFSLLQNTAGATVVGANNVTGASPLLGPLANNGGPTQTHLPGAGSPVINAGSSAIVVPPATDQRGLARVVGIIDIGSVELASGAGGLPTAVPTLSQWALGLLASLMAWFGIRRPREAAPRAAR